MLHVSCERSLKINFRVLCLDLFLSSTQEPFEQLDDSWRDLFSNLLFQLSTYITVIFSKLRLYQKQFGHKFCSQLNHRLAIIIVAQNCGGIEKREN